MSPTEDRLADLEARLERAATICDRLAEYSPRESPAYAFAMAMAGVLRGAELVEE